MEMQVKARTTSFISAMETCDRKWQRQNDMTSAHKHNKTLKKTRTTLQGTYSSVPQMGTNNQLGVCHGHIQLELHEELTAISAVVQPLPVVFYIVHKSICLPKLYQYFWVPAWFWLQFWIERCPSRVKSHLHHDALLSQDQWTWKSFSNLVYTGIK